MPEKTLRELQEIDRKIAEAEDRIRAFDPKLAEVDEPALQLEQEVEHQVEPVETQFLLEMAEFNVWLMEEQEELMDSVDLEAWVEQSPTVMEL